MKNKTFALCALLALVLAFTTPAFSQHIVGFTSLGPTQTKTNGNEIMEVPNPATNKIYVSDTLAPGTLIVVSGTTHTASSISFGSGVPIVTVNSTTNTIYALSGDQNIYVIDGSADQVIATIPPVVSDGCLENVVVDTSSNKLVVLDPCSKLGYVLDGSSYSLLGTVSMPVTFVFAAAVNPATHLLYVASDVDHEFVVADLSAYTSTTVTVPSAWPQSVAIDVTLNRIYMADDTLSSVYVFDGATNALLTTLKPGLDPFSVCVNQKNHVVSVSDGYQQIFFYHGFTLAADGVVKFSYPESILWFSVNSTNNLYYVGVLPLNSLAFIQGPTS